MSDDSVYTVKCANCGKEYSATYKTYKKNSIHLCKRCNGLRRVSDLHEGNTRYFSKPENRKAHSVLCRGIWDQRSDEFKSQRLSDLKIAGDQYRSSVDFPKIASEQVTKYFLNEDNRRAASERKKQYWDNLTDTQRKQAMAHLVEYWENADSDNIDDWYKRVLDGSIAANAVVTGPTEDQFMRDLQEAPSLHRINFERQYRSNIKHPDFEHLFPINPVTGGKLVNPYHIWDFIIYGVDKNILIDVDGKIHNIKPGIVKYGNKDIDFSELIQFNDSKRLYQTDGFDAYIIHAYNDKLSVDTEVLSLKDNRIISYRELLSIILVSQLSKSDLKEIYKYS